jgi:hypothetical protein
MYVPDDLPEALRMSFAEIVRGGSILRGVEALRREGGLPLDQAKALAMHLARRKGHCQKCDAEIGDGERALCARCKALTITW